MKNTDFRIRDPFILLFEDKYYMYASNEPYGFKAYLSDDLVEWSEPHEVFRVPQNFWATHNFWAPEVHYYKGNFYLFASLKSNDHRRATQIFKANSPLGPFELHGDGPVTPSDWECLDGTLYIGNDGQPYMVFCHEWMQLQNGTMCYIKLSEDLSCAISEPVTMFAAGDFEFIRGVRDEGNYVTDGPFFYRHKNGDLSMIWSSFGDEGYLESVLKSDNGEIDGNWLLQPCLFTKDGGHGMLFKDKSGDLKLSFHRPNSINEHLELFSIADVDGTLSIVD